MKTQAEHTAERIELLKEALATAKSKGQKVNAADLKRRLIAAEKRQRLEGFGI